MENTTLIPDKGYQYFLKSQIEKINKPSFEVDPRFLDFMKNKEICVKG